MAPTEQRVKATKARGLTRPDCEVEFVFMEISFVSCSGVEIVADNSKISAQPDAFFLSFNWPPKFVGGSYKGLFWSAPNDAKRVPTE
jgi:hypothetical protein